MKQNLIGFLLIVGTLTGTNAMAQDSVYRHRIQLMVDEDCLNFLGEATDHAYSGGIFLQYAYTVPKLKGLNKIFPKAGKEAINTVDYTLSQLIFTPTDLTKTRPIHDDYPYSGSLYLTRSLHSYNTKKQWAIHSGISLGVMGPISLAEDIQVYAHNITGDKKPMGWENQHPNDILINLQLGAEKKLISSGNWLELIGNAGIQAGSLLNEAQLGLNIRAGKKLPYFDGHLASSGTPSRRQSPVQIYIQAKPALHGVIYNSLLQGGFILNQRNIQGPSIQHFLFTTDLSLHFVYRNIGLTLTQKYFSTILKGLKPHEVGNITFSYNW